MSKSSQNKIKPSGISTRPFPRGCRNAKEVTFRRFVLRFTEVHDVESSQPECALQAEKKKKESNTIQEDEHGRRQQLIPYPEIGNDGGSNTKTYGIGQTVEFSSEWENALRSRAERPSIISKQAAIKIKKTAFSQSSSKANLMPVRPEHKPMVVKIFGKSFGKERLPGCFSISIKLWTDKQIATIKSTRRQLLDSIGISNQPCPKFSIVKVVWVADAFGNAFMRVGKKRNNESQLVPPFKFDSNSNGDKRRISRTRGSSGSQNAEESSTGILCLKKATNLHGIIR